MFLDLPTSSTKQSPIELHVSEQEHPLLNITDVSGQPDVTATEAPIIPPRPARPPRPFPPGKGSKHSPARIKGANRHTQKSNTQSTEKMLKQPRSHKQEPNTSDSALMQSVELTSELVANGATPIDNDCQVMDKEPAVAENPAVPNDQSFSQPAQNTDESHSESVVAQLHTSSFEDPAIIQAQPSTPESGTGATNQPETTNTALLTQNTEFTEEEKEDQVRFHDH